MNWLLDLLYPPKCPFCRRLLDRGEGPVCPKCQCDLPWTQGAQGEKKVEFLDSCVAPLWYEGDVRDSHHRYKFSGVRSYADAYGLLMSQCATDRLEGTFDMVCWAALSKKRLRKRGYDQSELLARNVGKRLGIPVVPLLDKTRDTPAQSGQTDAAARRANVLGAYRVKAGAQVAGKRVLLVDDVVTTGATSSECARMLRTAGAAGVCGLALAITREKM